MSNNSMEARIKVRTAWLDHYHECADCQCHQLCETGRERVKAMRASMNPKNEPGSIPKESLPAWMMV